MNFNVEQIKVAARGRWPELVVSHGGVSSDLLDGKEHACPKCGGTDRFHVFKNFKETGGCHCRKCHSSKNGDGISTLMWLLGIQFPEALGLLATELGISDNGAVPRISILAKVCQAKGIPSTDSLRAFGAVEAKDKYGKPCARQPSNPSTVPQPPLNRLRPAPWPQF